MSRFPLAALLALPFSLAASTAFAQIPGGTDGRVLDSSGRDVPICRAAPGGSRARANCDYETETVRHEQETKLSFEPSRPPSTAQCGANAATEYQQMNTVVHVNVTLVIADCTLASGAFTVEARVKDDDGEEKPPLEFSETWQRSDDNDVSFTADYPIGENVDLVSVRLRNFTCTCGDAAQEEPALAEEPTPAAR